MILIARSSFFNINHWSCLSAHDKITVFDFLVILEEYVLQPRLVVPINESVKAELGELQSTRIVQWYTLVLLTFLVPYVCLHVGSCVYRVKLQQGVSCVCSVCGRTLGGCVLAGQRCWWLHPQWLHTESLSPNTTVGSSICLSTQPSIHVSIYLSIHEYVYSFSPTRDQRQVDGEKGVWLNHLLTFSEVKQEDFYVNYSCHVYSSHHFVEAQFTLLPAGQKTTNPLTWQCNTNYDSVTSLVNPH